MHDSQYRSTGTTPREFTVAGVLERYYDAFCRQHGTEFSSYHDRILRQLIACGEARSWNPRLVLQ
jgi:hypothetical protein